MKSVRTYLTLLIAYMKVNWRSSLEYRTNFVFQTLLGLIEVGMYLFYWEMFFAIADDVGGIPYQQLAALVVFNHVIYISSEMLMGEQMWDAMQWIIKGRLDIFLVQPKHVAFQLFFSGAKPITVLQLPVGMILYFLFVPFTLANAGILIFGVVTGSVIFMSWVVMIHTLAFRLGNAEVVLRLMSVILHFAKRPATIFSFGIRLILYTVIPAAYLGTIQAQQVVLVEWEWIILLAVLALVSPVLATLFFRTGLRKYESGNLVGVRT